MGAFGLYLIKVSVCLILFYLFFKVLIVCFFPVTISDVFHSLYIPDSLARELNFLIPFALMFLVSTILLLQILRHDDSMIVKRKFKLTYISVFIGIFFVIFIISSPMPTAPFSLQTDSRS